MMESAMKRILLWMMVLLAVKNVSTAENKSSLPNAQPQEVNYDQRDNYNNDDDGNYRMFNSSLAQYGEWVDCNYGHVWRPFHPANRWRPYLNGRWVWTDYGWYWSSYEPFGWATYHYGRWAYDDYYGWIWVPDHVWGPAWVEWRYDDDYIGWAPLTPHAFFSLNVGITFSRGWVTPVHYWNFVPCRNFTTTRIVDYVQPVEQTRRIFGTTRGTVNIRTENNRVINRGIDVGFIERQGNTRINRMDVVQNNHDAGERIVHEGNRDRIEIYRPRLEDRGHNTNLREPGIRQQNRVPSDEHSGRNTTPRVRQYRESEQQFELPRRAEQQHREGQIRERQERQYFGNGRDQQPKLERHPEQLQKEDQIRQNHGRSGFERSQPQVKERSQPRQEERPQRQSENRGRGRKP
jgi:hypothetical protein